MYLHYMCQVFVTKYYGCEVVIAVEMNLQLAFQLM